MGKRLTDEERARRESEKEAKAKAREEAKARKQEEKKANEAAKAELKAEQAARKRSRWIAAIFYPDNKEHMELYTYLNRNVQMVSILHKGEPKSTGGEDQGENVETGKNHIHALIYFPIARTLKAFLTACDGALQHAELVTDCFAYAEYMLHATFAARHKTQYNKSDIVTSDKGGEIYAKLYGRDDKKSDIEMILYMKERAHTFNSFGEMVIAFAKEGLKQLIEFCRKNTYFLQNMLKACWKNHIRAAEVNYSETVKELENKTRENDRLFHMYQILKSKLMKVQKDLAKYEGLNPYTITFPLNEKEAIIK